MDEGGRTLSKLERANRRISTIAAGNTLVVHYSCLQLGGESSGSPMITGIVVRSLETSNQKSFTIGLEGEQAGRLPEAILANPEALERKVLSGFFAYVAERPDALWLTWKMTGDTFGFPVLAHRHILYGGTPTVPDDSKIYDLYGILKDRYGPNFVGHPRLERLVELNDDITVMDFLPGRDEPVAFRAGEFGKLRRSTARKTAILRDLFERLEAGTLRTNADLKSEGEASLREEWAIPNRGGAPGTSSVPGSASCVGISSGESGQVDDEAVPSVRTENGHPLSDTQRHALEKIATELLSSYGRPADGNVLEMRGVDAASLPVSLVECRGPRSSRGIGARHVTLVAGVRAPHEKSLRE